MADVSMNIVREHVDEAGRRFGYAPIDHEGSSGLGVHFSAFFGAWGNARVYRDVFKGYFHRLKMLGSDTDRDWLFLCDDHGVNKNGCYYLGEKGDLYVQRAMSAIIDGAIARRGHSPDRVVMLGSSMGATAALTHGLQLGAAGIVAISPHIDLDISAREQNRMQEVGWICPDGDALAAHNHSFTRPVKQLLDCWEVGQPLPRLFIQSCEDDIGVHEEQVLPLIHRWTELGGEVTADIRPSGGHTSDFATRSVLIDVTARILAGEEIPVERYSSDPGYMGTPTRRPLSHRVRHRLHLVKRRVTSLR